MNADQAQNQIYRAIDDLALQLEADSEELTRFLQAMAKFHRYSCGNVWLILAQRPDASRVAGYRVWQSLGRQVRQGAKGIAVLCPMLQKRRKGDIEDEFVVGFTVGHVFDVKDTTGPDLPQFAAVTGDPGIALNKLHRYALKAGIDIKKSEAIRTAQGVSIGGTILLQPGLPAAEEFAVLVHEIAHEMLHKAEERATLPKGVMELEAESTSFVVCTGIGLDCSSACSDYVKVFGGNAKLLRASLDRIQKAAAPILDAVLGGAA